ncbi:MAG: hypothetical protein P8N11_08550 [Gammaproteobacteria bacterium]|nr:hypothetical protein [Gammaproteobacteria bacterium]
MAEKRIIKAAYFASYSLSATLFICSIETFADVPRTNWGTPDLQGVWTGATVTPLERPFLLEDKPFLTNEERKIIENEREQFLLSRSADPDPGTPGGYNRFWLDSGTVTLDDGRSSLIIDPPDGRIPWHPEKKQWSDAQSARYGVGPFNDYTDLDTGERCITDGITMVALQPYNMNYQIVQTEDTIVIAHEMYHEFRIIPLDDRPFISDKIGQWLGDARAHWEGDTLVIESRNFANKLEYYWAWPWRSARNSLILVERLTRIDESNMDYQVIVADPEMFTQPWTISAPMTTDQASRGVTAGPIYEFACHEGNYALPNVLRGAQIESSIQ